MFIMILCSGCAGLGWSNEDAGVAMLASETTVPVNGSLKYEITRSPNTDPETRQWYQDMGVRRSATSWFGFGGNSAGRARTQLDK